MAKKINLKERLANYFKQSYHDDCLTEYEERKASYYDANKLPKDQINLMWSECKYTVANRPKWRFIYKMAEIFNF